MAEYIERTEELMLAMNAGAEKNAKMCGTSTSDITGTTVWCSMMIFAAAANERKVRNVNLHLP